MDRALTVLEQLSVSCPRKSRKSVRALIESVEELSESVDESWCDGVSRCGPDRLADLAGQLLSAQALRVGAVDATDCVSTVSTMLESLRACGNVAVQCESVLLDGGSDEGLSLIHI